MCRPEKVEAIVRLFVCVREGVVTMRPCRGLGARASEGEGEPTSPGDRAATVR
jgi:hypothetical protein